MIPITREQIHKIAPSASASAIDALINGWEVMAKHGVNLSKLRLSHAIAQWAYETNGFTEWSENLHYSAQRLLEVFPRYFTAETAEKAAHDGPEAIANIVYDDRNPDRRNKLGNVHDGDGWKYRGRGVMHTTGRENYAEASKVVGVDLLTEPDRLADPALSLVVACSYWAKRGCNDLADLDDIQGITEAINGGLNGLIGRREYLNKAKGALASAQDVASVPAATENVTAEPKWLSLARSEIGTKEAPGGADNPKVLAYYRDAGHPEIAHDETAWCAAFAGAVLSRAGIKPSGSLMARSYLRWGQKLDAPRIGCIAVLWRGSPDAETGHVAFVVGWDDDFVALLGGNQSNAVCILTYKRSRVLGWRWPKEDANLPAPIPASPPPLSPTPVKDQAMTALTPFLPIIEKLAPVLGTVLFGAPGAKLAPLAVAGVHALADALELDGERTPAAVAQKLRTMDTDAVPAVLVAAEAVVRQALPQSAPAASPAPVAPPAPAQGLYVDPINSLIKVGVAVVAGIIARKFGIDVTVAETWGQLLTPALQGIAALGVSGLMGWSLFRSIDGANKNTKAAGLASAS